LQVNSIIHLALIPVHPATQILTLIKCRGYLLYQCIHLIHLLAIFLSPAAISIQTQAFLSFHLLIWLLAFKILFLLLNRLCLL